MTDIFSLLFSALNSEHAILSILALIIAAILFGLIYVVRKFESTSDKFTAFLKESKEEMKEQLEVCERRCRENSDQFFLIIRNLASKIDQ